MAKDNKTPSDNDKTKYDSDKTIPDDDMTVLDSVEAVPGGTTVPDDTKDSEGVLRTVTMEKGSTILNTYRIESDSIEGGMGRVWRVHHTGWNVSLAMKQPKETLFQTQKQKENFIHECEAWINLGLHPHIVSCYYVREIGGIPTIFSEWMEAGSLNNIIEDGSLYNGDIKEQQERILDISIQFARGLHYAHEQGLIHQDVKPDNLLLNKEGEAKVADFGIAKARAELTIIDANVPFGGTIVSQSGGYTPAYCSMEQMNGEKLTRRTDIYSWAVSVMEMYLGDRPWANGVIAGAACGSYFRDARVDVPKGMRTLLCECLKEDEAKRPHDFGEVEKMLLDIYKHTLGSDYPRISPKAAADTADSLNNKALSFLDMGKPEDAQRCWKMALTIDPDNAKAVFNNTLHSWRSGNMEDDGVVKALEALLERADSCDAMINLTRLHLERGDLKSANLLLGKIEKRDTAEINIQDLNVLSGKCDLRWRSGEDITHMLSCISGDSKLAATSDNDGLIHIWDMNTGSIIKTLCPDSTVRHIEFVEKDTCLLAVSDDGAALTLWDYISARQIYKIKQKCSFFSFVCTSADKVRVLWGSDSEEPRLIDTKSGVCIKRYASFPSTVTKAALLDRENAVATCEHLEGIKLWSMEDGSLLGTPDQHWGEPFEMWLDRKYIAGTLLENINRRNTGSISVSFDKRYVLVNDNYKAVKLYFAKTGRCLRTYIEEGNYVKTACFTPDGTGCLIGGIDGLSLYTVPDFSYKAGWQISGIFSVKERLSAEDEFSALVNQAEEKILKLDIPGAIASFEKADSLPGFYNSQRSMELNRKIGRYCTIKGIRGYREIWVKNIPSESFGSINCLCVSNGSSIAVCNSGNDALVISLPGGEVTRTLKGHSNSVSAAAISGDGRMIATGSRDKSLKLWNISTGECIRTFERNQEDERFEEIASVCFSPDSSHVFAGNGGLNGREKTGACWNIRTGECIFVIKEDGFSENCIKEAAYSPDGKVLYLSSESFPLTAVESKSGRVLWRQSGPKSGYSFSEACGMAVKQNAPFVLTADKGGIVWLREAKEDGSTRECAKSDADILDICMHPSGRYVLTACKDHALRLWDMEDKKMLLRLDGHEGPVYSATFSPDGSYILSGGGVNIYEDTRDQTVRLWQVDYDYEFPGWNDWDEGARPYLETFLALHPDWNDEDYNNLITELQNRGFGWLRPEGVKANLEKMAPGKKGIFGWKRK